MKANRLKNFYSKPKKVIYFYFDGKRYSGFDGDSLASALIANGIKLVGRSFKYHRPRGIFSLGSEEPNALVTINDGHRTEPNIQATQVELYDGLVSFSQNRWPNLKYDFGSVISALSNIFPAGFYYKTFMWPSSMWKTYEYFIRRMSGLGKISKSSEDPDKYEHIHYHTDLIIVGGGLSGLISCLIAANAGVKTLLVDENPRLGGCLINENDIKIDNFNSKDWVKNILNTLSKMSNVTILNRSTVFGYHDHNYVTIAERLIYSRIKTPLNSIRQRLWKVRAKKVVLAQGLIERPLAIPGNDLPGVMSSSSIRGYINKYGVIPGNEAVICTNNDDAYRTALTLQRVGCNVKFVVDIRKDVNEDLINLIVKAGIKVLLEHTVSSIKGKNEVNNVEIVNMSKNSNIQISKSIKVKVDLVGLSGGWTPAVHLFSQSGGKLFWDKKLFCFRPNKHVQEQITIGGCDGILDFNKSIFDTINKTQMILKELGIRSFKKFNINLEAPPFTEKFRSFEDFISKNIYNTKDKAFVDFQNDVLTSDIYLASNEGYNSVEHLKRYTTLGMGTDQGKTSNVTGINILSEKLSKEVELIGTTTFRMPYTPVTFGTIGGRDIKNLFDPIRTTEINPWHRINNAKFEHVGQWMRAWYYPKKNETFKETIDREVWNTRNNAGILDASTLGKIDIKGQDSKKFLNMIYTNDWKQVKKGQCKYGIMLKEDGMILDDGVTSCINENHFHMTTTTGGASAVLSWMEEWLQTEWPNMDVTLTSVTEQWSVISIAGPKSKQILSELDCGIDLNPESFPFMTFKNASIEDIPVRIFRISFTGELSYEVNVPSSFGLYIWQKILKIGEKFSLMPYGTEAMHVLRAEKGFIIIGQETDGSVSVSDIGMDWIVSKKKHDFIGKRSLPIINSKKNRKQLVGIYTDDPNIVLPEGAHAVKDLNQNLPKEMLGHVTSSYFSPNCNRSIALALIKNGHSRFGDSIYFPLLNNTIVKAKIVKPIFYDPNGDKIDSI